ncbi:MAG: hypothetical protein EBS05_05895 [Proteobacteria bacterium]|nr:hypothetical protein [Pseudomonadota bacterium]
MFGVCLLLAACSTQELRQQHPSALPKPLSVSIPPDAQPQETLQFNDYTITRYFIEEQNPV